MVDKRENELQELKEKVSKLEQRLKEERKNYDADVQFYIEIIEVLSNERGINK
ncbi:hypothetical protein [Enterococcus sp. AD013-P3]|uniref:hypothetical protein n=1 Tax=Enterococcus sp. AD013-P3 TaxID=3411036 RepID=UPI003B9662C4